MADTGTFEFARWEFDRQEVTSSITCTNPAASSISSIQKLMKDSLFKIFSCTSCDSRCDCLTLCRDTGDDIPIPVPTFLRTFLWSSGISTDGATHAHPRARTHKPFNGR